MKFVSAVVQFFDPIFNFLFASFFNFGRGVLKSHCFVGMSTTPCHFKTFCFKWYFKAMLLDAYKIMMIIFSGLFLLAV